MLERQFDIDDFFDLRQKPWINLGELMHLVKTKSLREGIAYVPNALGTGLAKFDLDFFAIGCFLIETIDTNFETTQRFLKGLLKGPANGHHFTNRLHLCGQARIRGGEFLECKTWHFGHNVIDRRLKRGRRRATGDFVFQLIKGVTDSETRGDFSNRETRCFGRECRRAGHAGVHFNDDHATVFRIDGELNV